MKVFATSDIHLDYPENQKWLSNLSALDYQDDVLILAGDITDNLTLLRHCFDCLSPKFKRVMFVPGNHELWVIRDDHVSSIDKYHSVCKLARDHGIDMHVYKNGDLSIVPLQSWYDFSFGQPNTKLNDCWMDFRACVWPNNESAAEISHFFLSKNTEFLNTQNHTLISFSHFLPRIDLMPSYIPKSMDFLHPVMGAASLEKQIRQLSPKIHVYGHSHVNQKIEMDGIYYINNAFGYPSEKRISSKKLRCIHEQ